MNGNKLAAMMTVRRPFITPLVSRAAAHLSGAVPILATTVPTTAQNERTMAKPMTYGV
jgi:hypothetical protein